ncbi:asparagine synthase-related protein [Gordonia terrae]|uniref:asparagine synthase-related protein n=1 Tax=Gordonia terrae TaxID=2055 RepID=UPI003F6D186F
MHTTRGSFHLIASDDQFLRAYGSAYGSRRLYYTRHQGTILISDRAFLLATASNAEIDTSNLSSYLIESTPFRLAEQPLWTGVIPVPPGRSIKVRHDDAAADIRRWRELGVVGHLGPTTAARVVRRELVSAVEVRLSGGGSISSEMSGGFDSTSITAIASRYTPHLVAHTTVGRDPLNEDVHWATTAAKSLPTIEHDMMPPHEHALFFDGLVEDSVPLDEPSIASGGTTRVMNVYRRLRSKGSTLHLTGHGGDQLFSHLPVVLHDLVRRRPISGARRALQTSAYGNWRPGDLARVFLDYRPYHRWWADEAQSLTVASEPGPLLGWGVWPRVAPWVAQPAAETIRDNIMTTLIPQGPLAPTRAQNQRLEFILNGVRLGRTLNQMATTLGIDLATPFYDDAVIDSALSVDPTSTYSPAAYKPLLAQAMRGITPDPILTRKTKDEGSIDLVQGFNNNLAEITGIFTDSRLEQMGLIDSEMLRHVLKDPTSPLLDDGSIFATVACEMWVRTYEAHSCR